MRRKKGGCVDESRVSHYQASQNQVGQMRMTRSGLRQYKGLSLWLHTLSMLGFAVCISSGCAVIRTAPQRGSEEIQPMTPVLRPQSAKEGPVSGAVLAYDFRGGRSVVGSDGCRLRLENQTTKKSSFMSIKPDGGAFTTLEPGRYQLRRLGCGLTKVWDLSELLPNGFSVEPGRVSYLGKITFVFKEDELAEVKKGSRIESAEALLLALDRVPAEAQESVVSAFTGKAITRAMREGELREAFDVFGKGASDSSKALEPLLESLRNCATDAGKTDPLRLGTLQVVALYKDQRFLKFQEQGGQNAFADAFVNCIERSHENFRPNVPGELMVRTRY